MLMRPEIEHSVFAGYFFPRTFIKTFMSSPGILSITDLFALMIIQKIRKALKKRKTMANFSQPVPNRTRF